MKDGIKVLKSNYFPTKLPISSTIVVLLALDHWKASDIVYATFIAYLTILWIACVYRSANEIRTNIKDILYDETKAQISKEKYN